MLPLSTANAFVQQMKHATKLGYDEPEERCQRENYPEKTSSPATGSAMDGKKLGTTSGTEDYGITENKSDAIPVNDKS